MFRESLLERPDEVLGFVATQLLVPVSTDEPRATRARGWITEVRGVVEGVERRGVVFASGALRKGQPFGAEAFGKAVTGESEQVAYPVDSETR